MITGRLDKSEKKKDVTEWVYILISKALHLTFMFFKYFDIRIVFIVTLFSSHFIPNVFAMPFNSAINVLILYQQFL